jgi:DNA-binding CsgD family transcriptional regulator
MSATPSLSAYRLADPSVREAIFGFAEEAQRTGNIRELDALMLRRLAPFNLSSFIFYVATDSRRRTQATRIGGNGQPVWRKHYEANRFSRIDDLLRSGLASKAPTTWTRFREERALRPDRARIYHHAREFKLLDGFYLPIHQPDGSMLGVSMMSHEKLPTDLGTLSMLHMLSANYALRAETLSGMSRQRDQTGPKLTERQIECLQWVADGKSSWEIGEILRLSEHTVNEHLAAARRRLGMKTTTQAVIYAVTRGWVRP